MGCCATACFGRFLSMLQSSAGGAGMLPRQISARRDVAKKCEMNVRWRSNGTGRMFACAVVWCPTESETTLCTKASPAWATRHGAKAGALLAAATENQSEKQTCAERYRQRLIGVGADGLIGVFRASGDSVLCAGVEIAQLLPRSVESLLQGGE